MDTILPWSFPVNHVPALFCYLRNTYKHSFLKVFIISDLILNIFKPFCFSVMPFSSTPNITQNLLISLAFDTSFRLTPPPLNYAYIFFWSKSKILFFVNSSILCKSFYFIVFCRHPCFGYSVTGFNRFFFFSVTLYYSFNSLNFCFLFNPSFPLDSLSRKLKIVWGSLYLPQPHVSILAPFSAYALLSSTLSVLPLKDLQP